MEYLLDSNIIIEHLNGALQATAFIKKHAQTMGATLVTRNTDDFKNVDGLKYTNPFTEEPE